MAGGDFLLVSAAFRERRLRFFSGEMDDLRRFEDTSMTGIDLRLRRESVEAARDVEGVREALALFLALMGFDEEDVREC